MVTALAAITLVQSGCAKDGSEKIWINIVPAHPVTINADFSLYDTANSTADAPVYITIKAPWIKFGYTLQNTNTDDPADNTVTIIAINLIYSGYDMYGASLSGTGSFTATQVAAAPQTVLYPYLAQVAPGGTITAGTDTTSGTFNPTDGFSGSFYVSGLPLGTTSSTTTTTPSNYVPTYQIQATFVGWFGKFDNPKKRFQKTVTFSTQ